ncbi:MAG: 50S ribosomal protein L11 methyltransferase [Labilithrix sp.]|nr:50S ribosomal protein L11 methyltransferase [Labilithrix sp.]MCW5813501.1 50S ribosomal protein L11 methyltransferase [Labilithrix sp.]
MDAYARALSRRVTADSVVVDIGSGTGIAALIAARLGARAVHAIEINPAVHLLRDLAAENGLASKIHVHAASSFDVELSEKADVVVSDLRGAFALHDQHAEIVRDARARFLRPGGVMFPVADEFFVAGFESFELQHRLSLTAQSFERLGFRGEAALFSTLNTRHSERDLLQVTASDVVTTSTSWGAVDYGSWQGGVIAGTVALEATRDAEMHGLVVWFKARVDDDIEYENRPGTTMAYPRTVLPLLRPIRVARGARIEVTLRVDEQAVQWAWNVSATDVDRKEIALRQASFFGMPVGIETLRKASSSFAPERGPRAALASFVLSAMDGTASLHDIEERTAAAFPKHPRASLARQVRELVMRYAR